MNQNNNDKNSFSKEKKILCKRLPIRKVLGKWCQKDMTRRLYSEENGPGLLLKEEKEWLWFFYTIYFPIFFQEDYIFSIKSPV